jgi:hypothetical protein
MEKLKKGSMHRADVDEGIPRRNAYAERTQKYGLAVVLVMMLRKPHFYWGFGEPPRTRTWNPLIKSQLLYH